MRLRTAVIFTVVTVLCASGAWAATTVRLPDEVAGPTGSDVTVPIRLDTEGTDLTSAVLRFTYDDTEFQLLGVYETGFSYPMTLTWSNIPDAGFDTVEVQLTGGPIASPAGDHDVAWARLRVLSAPPASSSTLVWDQVGTTVNAAAADTFDDGSLTADDATVGFEVSDAANGAPDPSPASTGTVWVSAAPPDGLLSLDITIVFNPEVIEATGVNKGSSLPADWELTHNLTVPGRVLISMFGSTPLETDDVQQAGIVFHVTGDIGDVTPLIVTRSITNDGVTTYRDDGLFTVSPDADNDGVTVADGDCNDADPATYPGAPEIVGDEVDQSCDGQETCYLDVDDDSYRPGDGSATIASADVDCLDDDEALATDPTGDCNDNDPAINPAATEIAGDNVDQDCDTTELCYVDADDDTYRPGDGSATVASADIDCAGAGEAVAGDPINDCDDGDATVNPGATEIAGDEFDQNCDGAETCYADADDDGYRPDGTTTVASADVDCADSGEAVTGDPTGDCNDANAAVNPNVAEICGNSIDDNCDTLVDDVVGTRYVTTAGLDGINTCTDVGAPCLTIQHAIDVACPTETVEVAAGTFTENLRVPKALTVDGAGEGSTIVLPANSLPNPCAGSSLCGSATAATNLLLIEASDVTVSDMTFDGDNPALTSGIVRDGADLDARNGIVDNLYLTGPFDNTTVHNVTIRNVFLRGIYPATGGSGFNIHHNTVENVQGEAASIGIFNYGGSGTIADNTVDRANDGISANHSSGTQFLRNVVTNSGSGVHTDNAGDGGGTADVLQDNEVSSCATYGYGVWVFTPRIAPTVTGNTVTGCYVSLGLYAGNYTDTPVNTVFDTNVVDGQGSCTVGFQILTTTWYSGPSDVRATITDNTLTGCSYGIHVGEDSEAVTPAPDYTKDVTLDGTGNDIHGNDVGVLIDTDVDAGSTVNLSGNKIYDNTTSGFDNTGAVVPPYVLAECTWWGSIDGPVAPNNAITGLVDSSPWAANSGLTDVDYYTDLDEDGYGDSADTSIAQCGPPFPGRVADNTDCNDGSDIVHPFAYEFCDGVDNNCDFALNDAQANADCDDGNDCNVEACSGVGACFFDSFTCDLAGNLYYFRDSSDPAGVADGSLKGIPGVDVDMTGDATANVTSANPYGDYTLTAGGDETVTPLAHLGGFVKPDDPVTPELETYQHGISSLDATRIAQYAVSLEPFTSNQEIAGDVSDNGAVTSYDASLVAQFQVGLITQFPVAANRASDWTYVPASRTVAVVDVDLPGQDFLGILYGDVTATWGESDLRGFAGSGGDFGSEAADGDLMLQQLAAQAPVGTATDSSGGPATRLALGDGLDRPSTGPRGAYLYLASSPVRLENGDYMVVLALQNADGIVALDMGFEFDPTVASVRGVTNVGIASNLLLTQNGLEGRHAVSLYGVTPMQGSGTFLEVVFSSDSQFLHIVPFTAFAEANERRIPLVVGPGLVMDRGDE